MSERIHIPGRGLASPKLLARLGQRALSGEYWAHGSVEEAKCVIIPSFGQRDEGEGRYKSGISNDALADEAISRYDGTLFLSQWEVHESLVERGYKNSIGIGKYGERINTHHAAIGAARILREKGLTTGSAIVLAHPYHMPRADATILAELPNGMSTVAPDGLDIPWATDSSQDWTIEPDRWGRRERFVVPYFAALDWMDVSLAAGPPLETD